MSKGLPRSHAAGPKILAPIVKQTVTLRNAAMTVDGATGVGDGTIVIGDLPEGNILFLGATGYLSFAGPGGDAGLVDTWAGDYSVGTTADSNDVLDTTDVDLVAKTALAAATAEVSPRTRGTGVGVAMFDNTDGSLEINLNLIIDDADISADAIAFTVTGDLELSYIVQLDD